MISLENIVTEPDNQDESPLATFDLVNEDDRTEDERSIHMFEWLHGLERDGCTFDTELNVLKVSSDMKRCLESTSESYLIFPSRDVMERATEMVEANTRIRNASQRRRFEEFGAGPWEYVLAPSKRAQGKDAPRLYHRTSNGTVPITFNTDDFDSLPRFISFIHPLFAMLSLVIKIPDPSHYSSVIEEQLFVPFCDYQTTWPMLMGDPFMPPSPKRTHSEISDDKYSESPCNCSHCRQTPDLDPDCVSASDGCSLESVIDDTDAPPYIPPGVRSWAEGLEPSHDGEANGDDDLLLSYTREPTKTPSEVMGGLKEEDVHRERLANQVLADWCTARRKRARRSL
ncbi:hypothetical protein AAF712_002900 [Marasmius tenuissimus]|uniref:Uncharacterized protein n=1 Tax=Marasmius tenuissimus TaxID=585030 RepID=A0ABR3A8I3_9AGAR|nr:hypothetical protein PM082_000420 [Marasmius tenuissimus]